jgi:hypothetical protein
VHLSNLCSLPNEGRDLLEAVGGLSFRRLEMWVGETFPLNEKELDVFTRWLTEGRTPPSPSYLYLRTGDCFRNDIDCQQLQRLARLSVRRLTHLCLNLHGLPASEAIGASVSDLIRRNRLHKLDLWIGLDPEIGRQGQSQTSYSESGRTRIATPGFDRIIDALGRNQTLQIITFPPIDGTFAVHQYGPPDSATVTAIGELLDRNKGLFQTKERAWSSMHALPSDPRIHPLPFENVRDHFAQCRRLAAATAAADTFQHPDGTRLPQEISEHVAEYLQTAMERAPAGEWKSLSKDSRARIRQHEKRLLVAQLRTDYHQLLEASVPDADDLEQLWMATMAVVTRKKLFDQYGFTDKEADALFWSLDFNRA